jgi:hypothetical protein
VRLAFARPGLALIASFAALLGGLAPAASGQSFVPAKSARAFGDSLGVNVRLTYIDTPAYHDLNRVEARIRELGVRYVNDSLCPTCEYQIASLQRLAAAGVKANLGVGSLAGGLASIAPRLQVVRTRLRSSIASFASVNEPDISGYVDWIARTRAYQAELYRQVNADSFLTQFPVLGPALVNRSSRAALGDLTPYLDRGNLHPYPGGTPPLRNLPDEQLLYSAVSGSKPLQITEVGYHNDLTFLGSHRPASEKATAIYTPRIALEAFRFGIERTYYYTLADLFSPADAAAKGVAASENSFGLLRWDLTPKPSYIALRNLLRAVDGDSAPVAAPGGMRFALEGAGPDVRQLLLQSADGTYALVLWRDVSVWDWTGLHDLSPAPDRVDVKLGQPVALARRFDPVASDAETQHWTDPQKIPVDLTGAPVVLRLVPPGAAGGAGGATRGLRTGQPRRGCAAGARDKHARKLKHKRARRAAKRRRARFAKGRRPRATWSLQCVSSATRLHR